VQVKLDAVGSVWVARLVWSASARAGGADARERRRQANNRRRQSMMPGTRARTRRWHSQARAFGAHASAGVQVANGEFEAWEKERKALQAKLDALQDALNVDLGSLEWDGTLEDAEAKMKELVPALCSENEAEAREAQAVFDQWDKVRLGCPASGLTPRCRRRRLAGPPDYPQPRRVQGARGAKVGPVGGGQRPGEPKGSGGHETHRAARGYHGRVPGLPRGAVPSLPRGGPAHHEDQDPPVLLHGHGRHRQGPHCRPQVRSSLLSCSPPTHHACLPPLPSSRYVPQGLDIRELRAVYACLPKEFQLDSDGRKKLWRDECRTKLAAMIEKEKSGAWPCRGRG
jgi:hypothetical protein